MGCYVGGERFLERTFCASLGGALCIHRQPDNVGAERARVFALHYHRKNRRHHFTPASFKMRFPSAPASWPWVVTQTSLSVCGFTSAPSVCIDAQQALKRPRGAISCALS